MIRRSFYLIVCTLLLVTMSACSADRQKTTTKVRLSFASSAAQQTASASFAVPPPALLVITISANDLSADITQSVAISNQATTDITFDAVPNGVNRTFTAVAYDANGNALYSGRTTGITLNGTAMTVDILMKIFAGTQVYGTKQDDTSSAIARDSKGNVYIAGLTLGILTDPMSNATVTGNAIVVKFDVSGNLLAAAQFGTDKGTWINGIAVDQNDNIIVVGGTGGSLDTQRNGQTNKGYTDCFVSKLDNSLRRSWTRLIGDAGHDEGTSVGVDSTGAIYIAGRTSGSLGTLASAKANAGDFDVFVAKYSSSGTLQWVQQFGSAQNDSAMAVAVVGAGDVYVAGYTRENLTASYQNSNPGGLDAFVAKLDVSGAVNALQQFGGSADDQAMAIAVSADTVYVAGNTSNTLSSAYPNAGLSDIFVASFDLNLQLKSMWQGGSPENDSLMSIALDSTGALYITGSTSGSFPVAAGQAQSAANGGYDLLVVKLQTPSGANDWQEVWAGQIGAAGDEQGTGIMVDAKGYVLLTGYGDGSIDGATPVNGVSAEASGKNTFFMMFDPDGNKQ